jgi:very-short-patch-repair endonuclease
LRDFTPVRGLPVETVPWIFVDMAAVSGRRTARLAVALNTADVSGQTSYEEVGDCLRQVARRGKPGVRTLTAVLDARRPGRIPRATQLERELDELIERFNLPIPLAQFPFPGRQFVTGCVDRAYPDAQLILEADSRRWHTRIQDVKRDHERDHEAGRNGWDTLRIYREHMLGDPEGTAAVIAETYAVRLTQVRAVRANSRQ